MNHRHPLAMVMTTVESETDAQRLGEEMIDRSLAACVQIDGPLLSLYRWSDRVERAQEYRLTIKTTRDRWPALREYLEKSHPYDEPQLVMIKVSDSTQGYFDWVTDQTT